MAWDPRTDRRGPGRALGLSLTLGLGLGVALPAQAQDEPAVEEAPPLEVVVQPDPNDTVVILSDGVPHIELRLRQPGVRSYQNPHPIGERSDPAGIRTRGMGTAAVDTVYHGTSYYGEPTGIRTRHVAGARVYQAITSHGIGAAPEASRIRYHGGFR